MHEIGIVQEVLSIIFSEVRQEKITKVVLQIGKLSAVMPDAVRFGFELCSEGTRAEGARLEIIETPGLAWCAACEKEFQTDVFFGACVCGNPQLEWKSGDELKIREVEVCHV